MVEKANYDGRGRNKKKRPTFTTGRDGRTLHVEEYGDEGRTAFSVEQGYGRDIDSVFDLTEDRATDLLHFLAGSLGYELVPTRRN